MPIGPGIIRSGMRSSLLAETLTGTLILMVLQLLIIEFSINRSFDRSV